MITSIKYVLKENFSNLYRIYCIAKYELLADMRDSKFGLLWNFLSPAIQVLTYWLIFGIAWNRKPVGDIEYLPWLVIGYGAWWFIQPCITTGCKAVFSKTNVITKMKFPVSVLPATICCKEFFNHICMMVIAFVVVIAFGYYPNLYWLCLLYYAACAFVFTESVTLILSVLTMLWRDVKKLVVSLIRMLMYFSPVIWECEFESSVSHYKLFNFILKLNPIHYIIDGYRDSVFYKTGFWAHPVYTAYFWIVTLILFVIGCCLMYKFKHKFIDLI